MGFQIFPSPTIFFRILDNRINTLCQNGCPQWWFPASAPKGNGSHILTIADCLGLSDDYVVLLLSLLRGKWKSLKKNLKDQYHLSILQIHIFNGQQSHVRTWICFGNFPPNHIPYDQVFLSVACPPSIFTLIRSNSLTSPYKQSNYDPNMGLFIIFIIVLCLFSLVIKSIPMPKQKCIGLNQNEGALISLFEKEPLLCLQKWCYYNGFRSKHCSINIYGKDNTCKACISSYKNFSRDLMYIKGKSCPVLKKIFRKCLFT